MFGVAALGGRIGRRAVTRLSTSASDYPHEVALAGLGCAEAGGFMEAHALFDRLNRAGSDEYRTVLNARMGLAAAIAILSYASNLEPPGVYGAVVLSCVPLLVPATRLAVRSRQRCRRTGGRRVHGVGTGVRMGECDEAVGVPVYRGVRAPGTWPGKSGRPAPACFSPAQREVPGPRITIGMSVSLKEDLDQ
jgi:hypothetical protein